MAEAANYFKKRSSSPRSRSRLSYSSTSEDDGKSPLAVPEGLRALLNDISREVLLGQPTSAELYGFCADYLEQRLEERNMDTDELKDNDHFLTPQNSLERNVAAITSATLEQSAKSPFSPKKKILRREGTFSIYDSDSGVESSTTYAGHDCATSDGEYLPNEDTSIASPQPTLEDAMQRLAETIKEFDSHAEIPEETAGVALENMEDESANAGTDIIDYNAATTPRLIQIELVDRLSAKLVASNVVVKRVNLRILKDGSIEVVHTDDDDPILEPMTRIPLHLVDHEEEEAIIDTEAGVTKKIQGHHRQQILPPIQVGLQLGHPEQEKAAEPCPPPGEQRRRSEESSEAQTDSVLLEHAEVQTEASEVAHAHAASQTTAALEAESSTSKTDDHEDLPSIISRPCSLVLVQGTTQTEPLSSEVFEVAVQTDQEAEEEEPEVLEQLPQRPPTLPGSSVDIVDFELASRTRNVTPLTLKVQDDVVARVLLEHVGSVFPASNPRQARSVNYLDLSRLGDEGETPASDEIWLAVDGSGHSEDEAGDEEDKFLTTEDTDTYSVVTDKFSTMAGFDGNGDHGGANTLLLAPSSCNLISEAGDLDDLRGCESFDAEAEATARLQGVLAGELVPLTNTVQATDKNIVILSDKFGNMETILTSLCHTVENLQSQVSTVEGAGSKQPTMRSVRRTPTPPGTNGGVNVTILDQLVARIEHLSSDVVNMDNTRQLREDNLLLRKELQTYREREVQMANRLESLEKKLDDLTQHPPRGQRSRRNSIGSSRGTPELPPIRSKSIEPQRLSNGGDHHSDDAKKQSASSDDNNENIEPVKAAKKENKVVMKQPLVSQDPKSKKAIMLRRGSNASSSSGEIDLRGINRRKPITPKLDTDYFQTEIQIARSDNTILRQDIQVYRERESQLYRRNKELESQLLTVLHSPRPSSREPPIGAGGQDKSEVNINVDFLNDGAPKAVFEAKTSKPGSAKEKPATDAAKDHEPATEAKKDSPPASKREPSKERKAPLKKEASKEKIMAVPKRKESKKSSSSGSGSSDAETSAGKKKVEIIEEKAMEDEPTTAAKTKPDPDAEVKLNNTKNGVPKTKPTAINKTKPASKSNNSKKSPKGSTSSSAEEAATKSEKLLEDDQWKVTITSVHEMETTRDEPNKTIIVKPKTPPAASEVKAVAKKAKAVKGAKVDRSSVVKDPRSDPIPKPPQYPAARPPRGYVPPRPVPNLSFGVSGCIPSMPISGRASSMDSDSEVTHHMVIKHEPRDSYYVEAVPARSLIPPAMPHPPICQVRESPDGMNSSMLETNPNKDKCLSRTSTAFGITEITEDEENRDIVREYVLQEEAKISKRRSKLPLKFKDLKPASVAKNRAKLNAIGRNKKLKARSWSTDKLFQRQDPDKANRRSSNVSNMSFMSRHSMDRLPTLSAFDEERIVWLKNLEDEIALEEERKKRSAVLKRQQAHDDVSSTTSSNSSSPSTCISRGTSPYNRLQKRKIMQAEQGQKRPDQLDAIQHELSTLNRTASSSGIGTGEPGESLVGSKDEDEAILEPDQPQGGHNEKALQQNKPQRRSKSKSRNKSRMPSLTAECFLVSRGWQLDQNGLLRALDRIKAANFGRVQLATTINRVVESIRPHLDAVIIHIGNQELVEAAHSVVSVVENGENLRDSAAIGLSVAGSVATVLSRHIITAANQNRATQFVISLPLPVSLAKTNAAADLHYIELRRMFNATMKANCSNCTNVQCCENENLSSSIVKAEEKEAAPPPASTPTDQEQTPMPMVNDTKYMSENHQLTSAGMRKLARNWEECIDRIFRTSDGQLLVRRSSESSSSSGNDSKKATLPLMLPRGESGNSSSSGSLTSDSLEHRAPWKPY